MLIIYKKDEGFLSDKWERDMPEGGIFVGGQDFSDVSNWLLCLAMPWLEFTDWYGDWECEESLVPVEMIEMEVPYLYFTIKHWKTGEARRFSTTLTGLKEYKIDRPPGDLPLSVSEDFRRKDAARRNESAKDKTVREIKEHLTDPEEDE